VWDRGADDERFGRQVQVVVAERSGKCAADRTVGLRADRAGAGHGAHAGVIMGRQRDVAAADRPVVVDVGLRRVGDRVDGGVSDQGHAAGRLHRTGMAVLRIGRPDGDVRGQGADQPEAPQVAGRGGLQIQRADVDRRACRADRFILVGPPVADQGQGRAVGVEQGEAHADSQPFGQLGRTREAGVRRLIVRDDVHGTAGHLHAAGQLRDRIAGLIDPHDARADADAARLAARLGELEGIDVLARRDLQAAVGAAVHRRSVFDQGLRRVVHTLDHQRAAHAEGRRLVAEEREEIAGEVENRRRIEVLVGLEQSGPVQLQVHDAGDVDQFHARCCLDGDLLVGVLDILVQLGAAAHDRLGRVRVAGVANGTAERHLRQTRLFRGERLARRPDVHDPRQAQRAVEEVGDVADDVVGVGAVKEGGEREKLQGFDQQGILDVGRDVDLARGVDRSARGTVAVHDRLDVVGVEAERQGDPGRELLGTAQHEIPLRRRLRLLRHAAPQRHVPARIDVGRRAERRPDRVVE